MALKFLPVRLKWIFKRNKSNCAILQRRLYVLYIFFIKTNQEHVYIVTHIFLQTFNNTEAACAKEPV